MSFNSATATRQLSSLNRQRASIRDVQTAHHTFGPVQFASGNADQALDEFHAAPKLEPHRYNTHFNLSKLHDRKGRYNEARRHLEIMFALRPDDLAARRDLDELRELDQSFLSTNS